MIASRSWARGTQGSRDRARRDARRLGGASLRGAAVLALAAIGLVSAPDAARAYTFRQAPAGHAVRWDAERVVLHVDPLLCGDAAASHAVARDAAAAWTRGPASAPDLVVAGETAGAPGYRGDGRDENGIYLVRRWDYAPALAVTVTSSLEHDGTILDTDVLVAARADLVAGAREPSSVFDLQSVLTHELGHVLGLGESDDESAAMYASIGRGDVGGRSLGDDDVAGLAELYPAGVRRAASYGCAARGGSGGGPEPLALTGIALSLFVVRRRAWARARTIAVVLGAAALLCAFDGDVARSAEVGTDAPVEARVLETEVFDRGGLHVTVARVITATGEEHTVEIPGGTLDGIVQRVGDIEPPRPGDLVELASDGR